MRIRVFCNRLRIHHLKFFGAGSPLGSGTLGVKHLYEWFQQYGYLFRVILKWGIWIWQNFQDQAHFGPGTLVANIFKSDFNNMGIYLE